MKVSNEFVKGKHNIGWVDSDFTKHFGEQEIVEKEMPTFQVLPRSMNDAAIESELKPGLCTVSDIYAFLKNPPEGSKDGYSNIFYTPSFFVLVRWRGGVWFVDTWFRDGLVWVRGHRVFSPATDPQTLSPKTLDLSEPMKDLEDKLLIMGQIMALEEMEVEIKEKHKELTAKLKKIK